MIKKEIEKEIRKNKVKFIERGEIVEVFEFERISVLNLNQINADNPELDNYSFSGEMRVSIIDNKITGGGRISCSSTFFQGTAKISKKEKQIITLITQPITITHR